MYGAEPLMKQWLRDGAPITDAVDATYVLTNADAGSTIAFQVTGTQERRQRCSADPPQRWDRSAEE